MAYGDSNDFLSKLKSLVPGGWFGFSASLRNIVFGGLAEDLSQQYSLLQSVKNTTRISSTTGWILDLVVYDFFGENLLRRNGETDDAYRARFITRLFQEKVTRKGISDSLVNLTGRTPKIFEPASPQDTGGYGIGPIGYGVAGAYGSILLPNQIFITAYRPKTSGIPYIAGYRTPPGGYGVSSRLAYGSLAEIVTPVSDADIYALIAATKAAGITAWVDIKS